MKLSEGNSYRNSRASSLRQIADILEREGFIEDSSPLQSAAAQCASPPTVRGDSKEQYWEYQIANLEFKKIGTEHLSSAKPSGSHNIALELSVDLRGICLKDPLSETPFTRLGVDIVLRGEAIAGSKICSAWHLDRHPGGHTDMAHPEYHFQYGGRNMMHLADYGLQLLLESPRLAHPPLDGVLAIDFILSNYFGTEWQILRAENDQYKNLLEDAQKMFWAPYALAVSKIIFPHSPPASNWDVRSIFPQLV